MAFTLIELMVVVAIIGILAAMILPALSHSKARARAIVCMNDHKQLALAWTMYSGDNADHLVYNLGGRYTNSEDLVQTQATNSWVNNVMDWTAGPDNDNTNLAFVNNSKLGPYLSSSLGAYKCPGDTALSDDQKNAGWTARVRSVSMNAMVGDPGNLLENGFNVNNPTYVQFLKESDIPSTSSIYVFVDEHADSINDGYFLPTQGNGASGPEWVDLPASYHNGGGSFSFADGHTELHHWVCASTLQPNIPYAVALPMPLRPDDTTDLQWVIQRTSVPVPTVNDTASSW
jgi:prepilin-type N-terminal cleavage/methylation domain-containing protein/prepilin-type processing-associated H-X9-DG protein